VWLASIPAALLMLLGAFEPIDQQPSAACSNAIVNPTQPIRAQPGEQFAVAFESNPSTGYSWSITSEPDPAVLTLVDTQQEQPATPRPGAPGMTCYVFAAVGAGATNVEFAYARPFEPDVPPTTTATANVIVSSAAQVPVQLPAR